MTSQTKLTGYPAEAPASSAAASIQFPAVLAGFSRGNISDYRPQRAGMGYSVPYTHPLMKATVFVYNHGLSQIPDGPASLVTQDHFRQVLGDVFHSYSRAENDRVRLIRTYFRGDPSRPRSLSVAEFEVQHTGQVLANHVCLTGYDNHFIKTRITAPLAAMQSELHADFMMQLLNLLWPESA